MKCFHPDGVYVWDTWYCAWDDEVHCTFLQHSRPERADLSDEINGSLGHAVSRDLLHWENRPAILRKGPKGSHDEGDLWTGCSVRRDGKTYLYYTGNRFIEGGMSETVCLAISDDGQNYVKHPSPLFEPDGRYYVNEKNVPAVNRHGGKLIDCRDMCVVRDPDGDGWWGYFAARTPIENASRSSVIGLAYSHDMITWEQRPPCFAPGRYATVEVPEVFFLDGKWYMLCLTGNLYGQRSNTGQPDWVVSTIQAVAERPDGPFREIRGAEVLGSYRWEGFSAKTVEYHGRRYMFYTQGETCEGCGHGSVSLPSELKVIDGRLVPCWCAPLDKIIGEEVVGEKTPFENFNRGCFGTVGSWSRDDSGIISGNVECDWSQFLWDEPLDDCFFSADVKTGTASSAGIVIRASGENARGGAYVTLLDPERQEMLLYSTVEREFRLIARKKTSVDRDRFYNIKLLTCGKVICVYLDDALTLQLYDNAVSHGRCGLFAENGAAKFKNVIICRTND